MRCVLNWKTQFVPPSRSRSRSHAVDVWRFCCHTYACTACAAWHVCNVFARALKFNEIVRAPVWVCVCVCSWELRAERVRASDSETNEIALTKTISMDEMVCCIYYSMACPNSQVPCHRTNDICARTHGNDRNQLEYDDNSRILSPCQMLRFLPSLADVRVYKTRKSPLNDELLYRRNQSIYDSILLYSLAQSLHITLHSNLNDISIFPSQGVEWPCTNFVINWIAITGIIPILSFSYQRQILDKLS